MSVAFQLPSHGHRSQSSLAVSRPALQRWPRYRVLARIYLFWKLRFRSMLTSDRLAWIHYARRAVFRVQTEAGNVYMSMDASDIYSVVEVDAVRLLALWRQRDTRLHTLAFGDPISWPKDDKFADAQGGFAAGPTNPVPLAEVTCWLRRLPELPSFGLWQREYVPSEATFDFTNGVTRTRTSACRLRDNCVTSRFQAGGPRLATRLTTGRVRPGAAIEVCPSPALGSRAVKRPLPALSLLSCRGACQLAMAVFLLYARRLPMPSSETSNLTPHFASCCENAAEA
ncbi:hypothetical protein D9M68_459160 [compost metagenome]